MKEGRQLTKLNRIVLTLCSHRFVAPPLLMVSLLGKKVGRSLRLG